MIDSYLESYSRKKKILDPYLKWSFLLIVLPLLNQSAALTRSPFYILPISFASAAPPCAAARLVFLHEPQLYVWLFTFWLRDARGAREHKRRPSRRKNRLTRRCFWQCCILVKLQTAAVCVSVGLCVILPLSAIVWHRCAAPAGTALYLCTLSTLENEVSSLGRWRQW